MCCLHITFWKWFLHTTLVSSLLTSLYVLPTGVALHHYIHQQCLDKWWCWSHLGKSQRSVHYTARTLDPATVGCHEPPYHAVCADQCSTWQLQRPAYYYQEQVVSYPDPTLRSCGWITSPLRITRSGDVIHPSGYETKAQGALKLPQYVYFIDKSKGNSGINLMLVLLPEWVFSWRAGTICSKIPQCPKFFLTPQPTISVQ